ncbi:MAG TPA: hypothetical protein VEU33_51720 [Archangium sp.]|nr:hypothetical protein [Archangium sp.]
MHNLKRVALGVLLTALVGCGVAEPQEEQAQPGDIGETQEELTACYYSGCPGNYHTYNFITSVSCPSTGFGTDNARDCQPNTGTLWEQCESACPSGYVSSQISSNHPYCCLSSCTYAPRYRCTKI